MSTMFIHGIEGFPATKPKSAVATIGTFDGIHRGHQAIFSRVKEYAHETGLAPVLITFHPHPRTVVSPDRVPMLLTTIDEKKKFVPCFFDGIVLVMDFNQELMNMSAEEFVQSVLIDVIGVKRLIVGYDHTLGKNREGNPEQLKKLGEKHGFEVEVVQPVIYEGEAISSSRIRKAMTAGQFQHSVDLLGHAYAIYGKVERGIGLGRKIGYPTANLRYNMRKLLPPQGVYACYAQIKKTEWPGMMFIGQNHFNPDTGITVEANIFDFHEDMYDQEITVYPTRFIRHNRKFDNVERLVEQIKKDKEEVLGITNEGVSGHVNRH